MILPLGEKRGRGEKKPWPTEKGEKVNRTSRPELKCDEGRSTVPGKRAAWTTQREKAPPWKRTGDVVTKTGVLNLGATPQEKKVTERGHFSRGAKNGEANVPEKGIGRGGVFTKVNGTFLVTGRGKSSVKEFPDQKVSSDVPLSREF